MAPGLVQLGIPMLTAHFFVFYFAVVSAITVQDRDYRLIEYNQEFEDTFAPQPGDHCYFAYKGRSEKCENCPVEKTFADGLSHQAEESGVDKDGSPKHWLVRTSPIKNANGDIVAAFQPIVSLGDEKIAGYEALARWRGQLAGADGKLAYLRLSVSAGRGGGGHAWSCTPSSQIASKRIPAASSGPTSRSIASP